MLNHPVILEGPMLRYVFLSVFALLLLTGCGDGITGQAGGAKPVTGTKSPDDRKTRQTTAETKNDLALFLEQPSSQSCQQCDLSGADLTGADLTGANLVDADLTGANLSGAYLFRANLTGVSLIGANLTNADLTKANLTGANLNGAFLAEAMLSGANLKGAILDYTIMDGSILCNTTMPDGSVIYSGC